MATSRISTSMLASALPGIRRGAQALGSGGMAYDQGFDHAATLQSKLAQALATTRLHSAQASEVEQQLAARSPQALQGIAMTSNGIPASAAGDVSAYLQSGKLGAQYDALPADQEGPVLPRPDWESKLSPMARSLAATQTALALGDKNSKNVADSVKIGRDISLSDAIIAGTADPMKVAQGEYATKGSAPFHFAEYGVGNNLTGQVNDQTGPAQLFAKNRTAEIGAREAQAGASRASAANSYASAGQHNAQTQKVNQDIAMGSKGLLRDTDQGLLLVDPRTGQSQPVMGPDGRPAAKAQAPAKALPSSAAKGYLENQAALRNVGTALEMIKGNAVNGVQGDAAATGLKALLPDGVLARVDPAGVPTRAIIADIGSLKIHDRSGAAVTASETPRLKPFIPSATDSPETVVKKLEMFQQNYRAIAEESEQFYRDSGYNVPTFKPVTRTGSSSTAATGAPTPGAVQSGYRFKGGDPADQANWEAVR